jgi:hypothetical protein
MHSKTGHRLVAVILSFDVRLASAESVVFLSRPTRLREVFDVLEDAEVDAMNDSV